MNNLKETILNEVLQSIEDCKTNKSKLKKNKEVRAVKRLYFDIDEETPPLKAIIIENINEREIYYTDVKDFYSTIFDSKAKVEKAYNDVNLLKNNSSMLDKTFLLFCKFLNLDLLLTPKGEHDHLLTVTNELLMLLKTNINKKDIYLEKINEKFNFNYTESIPEKNAKRLYFKITEDTPPLKAAIIQHMNARNITYNDVKEYYAERFEERAEKAYNDINLLRNTSSMWDKTFMLFCEFLELEVQLIEDKNVDKIELKFNELINLLNENENRKEEILNLINYELQRKDEE